MSVNPVFLVMINRAKPQFRLQAAENGLQIGQLDVGLPEGGRIPP